MQSQQKTKLTLVVAVLLFFGVTTAQPVGAQNLVYTLQGVVFGDDATAIGYFDYNPTTQTYSSYSITTSAGATDGFPSSQYTPATGYAISTLVNNLTSNFSFFEASGVPNSSTQELFLATSQYAAAPGTYSLLLPTTVLSSYLNGSGEFASSAPTNPNARGMISGNLVVTNAVPEASTTVSFSLLLVLGLGGAVVAARKKKATV